MYFEIRKENRKKEKKEKNLTLTAPAHEAHQPPPLP
jgi:hypothetical protein